MSLMDRFTVLATKAQSNGLERLLVQQAFYGSSMEGFDNGSDITDVILWDEEPQSAILFLDKDWNVSGFTWNDEEANPSGEWNDSEELASFFADCIAWARENKVSLEELGCRDADEDDGIEDVSDNDPAWECISDSRTRNLLNELRTTIEGNYCSMDDIAYVEMMDRNGHMVCISPAIFMEMASQIEYQDGRGEATIHDDLKVVMKDGSFIGRMWSDGSEWFRFYEKPKMNVNIVNLGRDEVCFFNSDMD